MIYTPFINYKTITVSEYVSDASNTVSIHTFTKDAMISIPDVRMRDYRANLGISYRFFIERVGVDGDKTIASMSLSEGPDSPNDGDRRYWSSDSFYAKGGDVLKLTLAAGNSTDLQIDAKVIYMDIDY